MKNAIAIGFCFCLLLASTPITTAFAQNPPDIGRWSGSTAITAPSYNQGDALTLTWGFAQEGLTMPEAGFGHGSNPNDIRSFLDSIYGSQAGWQPLFQKTFDRWSSVSGVSYIFEANDDGATFVSSPGVLGVRADVRIGAKPMDGNFGLSAYNYFPNSGDMVLDSSDVSLFSSPILTTNLLAHEHGHGLGMAHINPNNGIFIMEQFINGSYDGPQYHDILMAHRGYGDVNEKTNAGMGNDIFGNATDIGMGSDGTTIEIGLDAGDLFVEPTEIDFVSIDDESDTDYFSFSVGEASTVDITLDALGEIYQVGPQGGPTGNFDTSMRSDLALELYGTDGTTLLASADLFGLGQSETLMDILLSSAGTYFVRVSGTDNADGLQVDTQFFSLGVSFTTAIPEPASGIALLLFGAVFMRRRSRI